MAPLGRAVAAGLLPWHLHRANSDGAELNYQCVVVVAADGAGLAAAHRRVEAAVAGSEPIRSQGRESAIGWEGTCTEMNQKQVQGVVLNGWYAARRNRST